MFTHEDIGKLADFDQAAQAYCLERRPQYVCFNQFGFEHYESEESIFISRAAKQKGENGLGFWVATYQTALDQGQEWRDDSKGYFETYIVGAQCEPITEDRFNEFVSKCCERLAFPLCLPLRHSRPFWKRSGFVGALLMHDDWNLVDLIAEYEDEYLHFYWETTA